MNRLKRALAARYGYTIKGEGYDRKHYALTFTAALSWAGCYKSATITRRGQFIASKTTR